MRKIFLGLTLAVMTFPLVAQQQAPTGIVFNVPTQFYQTTSPATSKANDTTTWYNLSGVTSAGISIWGSADDSASTIIFYRLRQKVAGYSVTSTWTLIDTLGQAGDGTLGTTTGAGQLIGNIAYSTLLGYSEIQFYVDFLSQGSAAAQDGTANVERFFYMFPKADAIVTKGRQ